MGKTFRFNDDFSHKKKTKYKNRRDKRQKVFQDRYEVEDKYFEHRDVDDTDTRVFKADS
jgi:hypothetical protein